MSYLIHDTAGALAIPTVAPAVGTLSIGDPGLQVILDYLKAFVNANALAAWQAVAPSTLPVQYAFTHDPSEVDFNEKHLPALYLFRAGTGKPPEYIAEDWLIQTDKWMLYWVMPNAQQETRRIRKTVTNAIIKVIRTAIEHGRDPSYIAVGDSDLTALTQGSQVLTLAGLMSLEMVKWEHKPFTVHMDKHSRLTTTDNREYDAIEFTINATERLTWGIDNYDVPDAVDVTFLNDAGEVTDLASYR